MPDEIHTHQRHEDAMDAAILNAITALSQKVDANHKESTETLRRHMEDEEGEIEAMTVAFNEFREESNRRFDALSQSMLAYNEGINVMISDIHTAFLKSPSGTPDFDGHRDDHDYRKAIWDTVKDMVKDALRKVGTVMFVAILTAAAYGVWIKFLQGPPQ